jgi:hypothetical protein
VRALVSYYAVVDIRAPMGGVSDKLSKDVGTRLSPVAQLALSTRSVPLLIARAGQDDSRFNATMDAFVAEALKQNLPFEVLSHPDCRRGFDILDDDVRSREILTRTFAFLKANLGDD